MPFYFSNEQSANFTHCFFVEFCKKPIVLSVLFTSLAFSITAHAEANLPPPVEDMVKLEKMAGSAGPFTVKDNFPKDYFLIPKNLPYLVGLSLYDPSSSKLNLTQKQIDALVEIKKQLLQKKWSLKVSR